TLSHSIPLYSLPGSRMRLILQQILLKSPLTSVCVPPACPVVCTSGLVAATLCQPRRSTRGPLATIMSGSGITTVYCFCLPAVTLVRTTQNLALRSVRLMGFSSKLLDLAQPKKRLDSNAYSA
ncbi:hypothetical protein IWW36_005117, partial [Coemansia brasiliensis]